MGYGLKALALVAILVAPPAANAAQITTLIGDKDGFGIGAKPDQPFDAYAIGSGDGDGTDIFWMGDVGSKSVVFNYALPAFPINAARFEVFTGGQGWNPFDPWVGAPTSVFLNETFIGYLTIGDIGQCCDNNIARKDIFDLGPYLGLLTGSDTFRFQTFDRGDGWVLDYAELTLQTRAVPEPGTLALLSLGLLGLGVTARRRLH